jgi:hypothetical protein
MCRRSWPRVWRPNRRRWCPVLDPLGPLHFSWEVTARALGGTLKARIRWRRLTNAISNQRICKLPRSLRTNKVAVWRLFSCTGRAPGASRLGNCAPRKIGASWTWKVFIKGLKTLPITRVDRCGGLAGPTGRSYRNPAKTHVFTDSCSEPNKVGTVGRTVLVRAFFNNSTIVRLRTCSSIEPK